jgi:hypothetical protein
MIKTGAINLKAGLIWIKGLTVRWKAEKTKTKTKKMERDRKQKEEAEETLPGNNSVVVE